MYCTTSSLSQRVFCTAMGVLGIDALQPWDSGTSMLANVKRRITMGLLLVLAFRQIPLGIGELSRGQQAAQDLADVPCRVALCFSGSIQFFGKPLVHQSVRQNVIESIKAEGCRVDVFAYASPKDATPAAMEQVDTNLVMRLTGLIYLCVFCIRCACPLIAGVRMADTYWTETENNLSYPSKPPWH